MNVQLFFCGRGWLAQPGQHPPEAPVLTLATHLAAQSLGWRPRLSMGETIGWTGEWYAAWQNNQDMSAFTAKQIIAYQDRQDLA